MRLHKYLAVFLVLTVLLTGGAQAASAAMMTGFDDPEDLGTPIKAPAIFGGAFGTENGHTVQYVTTNGSPAIFSVVDLVDYRVLATYPLHGADNAWAHTIAPDGTVYIGATATGELYRYSPTAKQVVNLGRPVASENTIWDLDVDPEGNVYGATYPGGKVFKYNSATGEVTDYGAMVAGQQYARSIAYANGFVYAGTGTQGNLVKLNPTTGEKTVIPAPPPYNFSPSFINGLDVTGGYLFVYGGGNMLYAYNLQTGMWIPNRFPGKGIAVSPAHNGKIYYAASNNQLASLDLTTFKVTFLGVPFTTGMRPATWVELTGDPDFPGKTLATTRNDGFTLYYNPQTGKSRVRAPIVEGQGLLLQTIENGPDGKLYISGYQAKSGAQYDPVTGARVTFALDQAEGMGSLGTTMWMGVYPSAIMYAVDTTRAPEAVKVKTLGFDQDRPFAITSGEGKLIVGTVPGYGKLGGALTIYDPGAGTWATHRNVVQDQSIISVAYRDGKVYGSTSVWGGLGSTPTATEAKIFVWDIASGQKLAEFTPQIPGIDATPKGIGQLSFGPDGKLWGAAQGTIFVMNPETFEVERARTIFPSHWDVNHYLRPVYLRWGPDGLLYTTLDRILTVVDPETLESRVLDDGYLAVVGDDGHLYYSDSSNLMRIKRITFESLTALTRESVVQKGLAASLVAKLNAAQAAAQRGNVEAKAGILEAFVNEVAAQSGKEIDEARASELIRQAGKL